MVEAFGARRRVLEWQVTEQVGPEILLAGPRVSNLKVFFERQGYQAIAAAGGQPALSVLESRPCALVLCELGLGDLAFADFFATATGLRPDARWLLLDDPSRALQVVKALGLGVDSYCPTPPDEAALFRLVERLVSASGANQVPLADHQSATSALDAARNQVIEAEMKADMAVQELDALKETTDQLRTKLTALEMRPSGEAYAEVQQQLTTTQAQSAKLSTALEAARAEFAQVTDARDDAIGGRIQAEANEQAALQARNQAESLALDVFDDLPKAVEKVQAELSVELNRAAKAEEQAEERAIDAELATDELRSEIARLEEALKAAEAAQVDAEARFKEQRLRLVEAYEAKVGPLPEGEVS